METFGAGELLIVQRLEEGLGLYHMFPQIENILGARSALIKIFDV